MIMKKLMIVVTILPAIFAAGCNQPTITESKQEAYKEWANSRVKIYYSLAQDQYKNGQLAQAREKAIEALALDNTSVPLRLLLGKIYIEEGKFAAAIVELDVAAKQAPKSSQVFYLLGVAYEKNAQPEQAITNYNRAFELDRANIAAVQALAEVLVSLGEAPQAQQYLTTHMNRTNATAGTYELAGRIAMILKQYPKASEYFQQACDADMRNHRYPEMLARSLLLARKYRQAADVLESALAKKDYKPASGVYVILGDCYMALRKIERATRAYRRACQSGSGEAQSWVKLARAELMQRRRTSAIHAAAQARRLAPTDLEAALIFAYAMIRDDQANPAILALEDARAAHADDPMLICLLGEAYAAKGQADRARELFAQAVQASPRDELARKLLHRSNDWTPGLSGQKAPRQAE
ncbi:MAG: hypothetical protein DRP83_08785 [Planctomycetota bacterium]|nr:MAG: hypothetical protein DRP83_08785 [Planctomycetota bacterium]